MKSSVNQRQSYWDFLITFVEHWGIPMRAHKSSSEKCLGQGYIFSPDLSRYAHDISLNKYGYNPIIEYVLMLQYYGIYATFSDI